MALKRPPLRTVCCPPADRPSVLSRINTTVAANDLNADADCAEAIVIDGDSSCNSAFTEIENCQTSAASSPIDRGGVAAHLRRFPLNFTASERRPRVIKARPKRGLDYRVHIAPVACGSQPPPTDSRTFAPILSEQADIPMLNTASPPVPLARSHTKAPKIENTLIRKLTTEQMTERYESLGASLRPHMTSSCHPEAAEELPHSSARFGLNDSKALKGEVLVHPQSTPLNVPSSASSTPPMPCGQRPKHSMRTTAPYVHAGREQAEFVPAIPQPFTLPARTKSVRFSEVSSPCPVRTKVNLPLERKKSYSESQSWEESSLLNSSDPRTV